jgi:lipopolysaccharide/colanic/teichoic acid biosynthesis glycosyltransferase
VCDHGLSTCVSEVVPRGPWPLRHRVKRILDVAVATSVLVVLAPALAVIAAVIRWDSPGPVLFRQQRRGRGERVFQIWKFRTMCLRAEELMHELEGLNIHAQYGDPRLWKVPDDPRVTRVGRFLRRFSLDELPQLVNVIRGEMSLVGPRPLMLSEDAHVQGAARVRVEMRPGITGPWQVCGRNAVPFEEMLKLDCLYVTEWSLRRDFHLLLLTLPAIFRSQVAY